MTDKSKMPDFKEISSMASKLFKDIKTSITEIVDNYKRKRHEPSHSAKVTKPKSEKTSTSSAPKTPRKKTTKASSDSDTDKKS